MIRSGAVPANRAAPSRRQSSRAVATSTLRLRDDPFRLCLMALIVFTLSRLGGYFGILRLLRPALLLFGICVGYALLHRQKLNSANLAESWTVRILCALGVATVGSALFGISLGHSAVFIL